MLVFFRTSTEAIGTVFSTPSRSDVAQKSTYEGSHDAKAAGNLPASRNATRSPMDSISLHWNTSPQLPANIGLRSRYALRLDSWAKKYVTIGTKRISLEQLRKVLGLESVRDAAGNIIQEAPLAVWANLRQRALDVAITEINKKTDLNIEIESLEQAKQRRVTTL